MHEPDLVPGLARVLVTAGGTGGHLFPAEALAAVLQERGIAVHLAGFCLQHDVAKCGSPLKQNRTLEDNSDVRPRSLYSVLRSLDKPRGRSDKARCDHQ